MIAKLTSPLVLVALVPTLSYADQVVRSEFGPAAGEQCSLSLFTDAGPSLTVRLSDVDGTWELNMFVSGVKHELRAYFGSNGLRDEDALKADVTHILFGFDKIEPTDAEVMEVQSSELTDQSVAIFTVETGHRVSAALDAMTADAVRFGSLAVLSDATTHFEPFRQCALAELGIPDGGSIPTDFREEYRLSFETGLEMWVSAAARADSCLAGNYQEETALAYLDRASSAFYPGITNYLRRSEYVDGKVFTISMAELTGRTEAMKDGCLMAANLAELSERIVLQSIEAAEEMD